MLAPFSFQHTVCIPSVFHVPAVGFKAALTFCRSCVPELGYPWDIPGLRGAGGAGQGLLRCFLQAPETEGLWGGQTGD